MYHRLHKDGSWRFAQLALKIGFFWVANELFSFGNKKKFAAPADRKIFSATCGPQEFLWRVFKFSPISKLHLFHFHFSVLQRISKNHGNVI